MRAVSLRSPALCLVISQVHIDKINNRNLPMGKKLQAYGGKDYDPKTHYVAWNGDIREKPNTDRWTGSPDYEDTGFDSRSSSTSVPARPIRPEDRTGIQPVPKGHQYTPAIPARLSPEAEAILQGRLDAAESQREIDVAKHKARQIKTLMEDN